MTALRTNHIDGELARVQVHRWLAAVLWNWLLIGVSLAVLAQFTWPARLLLLPLALIVIGTRQHSLALLSHEAAHHLCSRNRVVNDVLATLLCAYPLTASLRSYRRFHFAHHRAVGSPEDPEFGFKGAMGSRWDLPVTRKRIAWQFAKDCFGLGLPDILETSKTLMPIDSRDWFYFTTFWIGVVSLALLSGQAWTLAVWFVALSTVQWAVFRVRIWTEHAGLGAGGTHRFHTSWWQRMFLFPINTWCHYEHHEVPSAPFHRLPTVRRELSGVPVTSVGELFQRLSRMPACATGRVPLVSPSVSVELPPVQSPVQSSESSQRAAG